MGEGEKLLFGSFGGEKRETKKLFNVFVGLTRNMKLEVIATCSDRHQCKANYNGTKTHPWGTPGGKDASDGVNSNIKKEKERTDHASVSLSLRQCLRTTRNR